MSDPSSSPAEVQSVPTQEERQALVPTGRLRAALYLGGPTNVVRDAASGALKGVGYTLGKELARRMGVPYEPVIYQTPRLLVEDATAGTWDVAFVAQDPDRERSMRFTTVYLSIEHGFLVPEGSTIKHMGEVNRPGIRVGVPAGGAVIPPLKRTLGNAELIEISMPDAADLVRSGKVDVFAANKANLFTLADALPGARILEGHFSFDQFAIGVPHGREPGLACLQRFLEDAKAGGLIDAAVRTAGVRGAILA